MAVVNQYFYKFQLVVVYDQEAIPLRELFQSITCSTGFCIAQQKSADNSIYKI